MVDKDFQLWLEIGRATNGETITVSSGWSVYSRIADGKKENYSIQSYSYTLMMENTMRK